MYIYEIECFNNITYINGNTLIGKLDGSGDLHTPINQHTKFSE